MAQHASSPLGLIAGLLALDEGRIKQAQLLAAFRAWSRGQGPSLVEILVAQGALDEAQRARLEQLAGLGLWSQEDPRETPPQHGQAPETREPALSSTVIHVGSVAQGSGAQRDPAQAKPAEAARAPNGQRYQVLRAHARGGLGEVFLALDAELNRQVALKELQGRHAYNALSQSRFLLEAEVTGRLEHPGIVPVYGLGRHADGRPYYAMRFIAGETLKDAIERFHGPQTAKLEPSQRELAFRRLLRSIIDACNTVAYAHSRGIVHRDLKPENIMLGRFGETLVVDWGIAKPIAAEAGAGGGWTSLSGNVEDTSLTLHGSVVGTPRYMSPEQAGGRQDRVGPCSDVYSLGATLYCLLVGHAPFQDDDVPAVLRRVCQGIFPSPSRLKRGVDSALEAICLKAMALEPDDRYHSPLELAEALEVWLADVRYRREQELALGHAKRSLARLCFERACNLFGREMHREGMLWLARALENVPEDSPGLNRVIRANLHGWHAGAKLLKRTLPHEGEVYAAVFSPDGRRLATACQDAKARIWDVASGRVLSAPLAHDGPVRTLTFGADGTVLVSGSLDGTIRRWDSLTGEPIGKPFLAYAPVADLTISRDGSMLAAPGKGAGPCLWDTATGEPVRITSASVSVLLSVVFSPNSQRLAAGDDQGRVWVWDIEPGKPPLNALRHEAPAPCLAFSPDGRRLLTGCLDGKARIWDLDTEKPLAELSLSGDVSTLRFSPLGRTVATACHDGTARLFIAETGTPIGEPLLHRGRVDDLVYSPDGLTIATAGRDGLVRFWDADSGLPIGPALDHRGTVHALALSGDGQRLASACSDKQARVWTTPIAISGEVEQVSCWVGVTTELEFDEGDAIRPVDHLKRFELSRRLQELGGAPLR
jgi:WD40 repeat protein/serine/threonine protein kinase